MFSEKFYWNYFLTNCCSVSLHTHKWIILLALPSLLFPFPSLSFWHPSLSTAMDWETNFYHYTLQVKKGSWECVIYAGFDFYVASTGSSIIAPLGTLVHWAPDEMLSWHRYQSPYASPCRRGACRTPSLLPTTALPLSCASMMVTPTLRGLSSLYDLCGSTFLSQYCEVLSAFSNRRRLSNNCSGHGENKVSWDPPGVTHPCSDTWVKAIQKTWGAFICKPQLYRREGEQHI